MGQGSYLIDCYFIDELSINSEQTTACTHLVQKDPNSVRHKQYSITKK